MHVRAATIAFVPQRLAPAELVAGLGRRGVMAGSGHFYSPQLCTALGLDASWGVVRVSLVHYNYTSRCATER